MIEDPFLDYPDFGRVLDQMAERGLHLYYHRVRAAFKDAGTRWREKWELRIRAWRRKARIWDAFSRIFDKEVLSVPPIPDLRVSDPRLAEIIEKIRRAFQAQRDLVELQNWLLLDAKINYPAPFAKFVERSLMEWRTSRGGEVSSPLFEVAPRGTLDQLKEVEQVLRFIESTNPIGKMDGLPVHSSEEFEYVRLWLRSILGLSADGKTLWSVRDVRKIYGWRGMGKKLGCEANPEQIRLSCARDGHLTGPHTT